LWVLPQAQANSIGRTRGLVICSQVSLVMTTTPVAGQVTTMRVLSKALCKILRIVEERVRSRSGSRLRHASAGKPHIRRSTSIQIVKQPISIVIPGRGLSGREPGIQKRIKSYLDSGFARRSASTTRLSLAPRNDAEARGIAPVLYGAGYAGLPFSAPRT
jgi:hypothetical protein